MERRTRTKKRAPSGTRRTLITPSIQEERTPTRRKQKKQEDVIRYRPSIVRGLFFLCLLFGGILFIGSIFVKNEIQAILAQKITSASSIIYSRPFPLVSGISLSNINLEERLLRLNFRKVESPEKPGEYALRPDKLYIYTRDTLVRPDTLQKSGLYIAQLNSNYQIEHIKEASLLKPIAVLWIEPEILSVLGDSSQRANNLKHFSEFNQNLKNAILATEDEHFYYHFGIDPISILRASLANLKSGKVVQGGSTLTQQLAKNLFFSSERTFFRKIKEALAALILEAAYTKDQIFEMYLNEIFLGQEGRFAIHGFGEASKSFFGKEVSDINLAEAAMLAGIIKAPSSYSPRNHFNQAKERQEVILNRMESIGMITKEESDSAKKQTIKTFEGTRNRRIAPYFVDYVQREIHTLITETTLASGAFKIVSGIDLEYQLCAERSVESGIAQLEKTYPYLKKSKEKLQASLVSVEPASGEIRAWVGGKDFGDSQFDRVSLAKRQPGSTFKPFVYLTALDSSLNQYKTAKTTSILIDEPVTIDVPGSTPWSPQNYDKDFKGEVRLRDALALSLNIPTVNLAQKVGIKNISATAKLFGFGDDLPAVPSLALGAGEVTPLELTQAYAIIANGGIKRKLQPFSFILDSETNLLKYKKVTEEQRIVHEAPTYILTDILRTAVDRGTGTVIRRMGVEGAVAGKTGTTNDARDSWFVGYTPKILTVVWVGYDSNKPIKLTGAQAAAPLWASYMKCISRMEPQLNFIPPEDVVEADIDKESGLLMTPQCPETSRMTEIFVRDSEPITPCPVHSSEGSALISEVKNTP